MWNLTRIREDCWKIQNIKRLNSILLNTLGQRRNPREFSLKIELNYNKSTSFQNLWDTVKVVIKGKFIALNTYIRK